MIYRLGSFDNGDQNALGARILICAAEARPTFARRARAAFGRRPQSYPLRDEPAMHWKVRFARNPSHTRLTNHNGRDGAQSLAVLNISQILMLSLTAKPEHAKIKLGSAYSCNLVERPLMLKSFWLHCRLAALPVAVGMFSGGTVSAQDYGAPCGRDAYGSPLQCARPDAGANMESACLTTGRVENCVPYHRNSCEIRGFQQACRLYNLGQNCFGGDQNVCNYYVSILRANTACELDRNQGACTWLQQQRY